MINNRPEKNEWERRKGYILLFSPRVFEEKFLDFKTFEVKALMCEN